jgi:hypothetical protein
MSLFDNYKKPTPAKWRKIGDAILLGSSSFSGMVMGLPLSEHAQLWTIFILNAVGVVGKVLTNFFKDEDIVQPVNGDPAQ